MVNLPFDLGQAPAGVRKPVWEVGFGSGSAGEWAAALVSVVVEAGQAPSVDVAELRLASVPDAPRPARDEAGSVALGFQDSGAELVFTGHVERIRTSLVGPARITAVNGGANLAQLRVTQSYEKQSAGDIVRDLAQRAGVETDAIEGGVDLPFYALDATQTAYQHIARLARLSGFQARMTPEGKLAFAAPATGSPVHAFAYASDVLGMDVYEMPPQLGAVTVTGEGAAGNQGADAWGWIVKDPASLSRSAGTGQPERQFSVPELRSADTAQSAADAIAGAAVRGGLAGRLLVPGAPGVAPGSAVEVTGAPEEALNGTWLAARVRHRFSKSEGFTTLLDAVKGDGAGLGLGGVL